MLATQQGYTGHSGDYYPAAACTVPAHSVAEALLVEGLAMHTPQEVKKIHLHIKNLKRTDAAPAFNHAVAYGGYSERYALACSLFFHSNGAVLLTLTTTIRSAQGFGKYLLIECSNNYSEGYFDGSTSSGWRQKIPTELEMTYEAGRVRMWVDGVLRIDRDDVLNGSFVSAWEGSKILVRYNPGWSYDLVDFSYETEKTSGRVVPMKTADGQNALYEVYTQQVVEI